MLTASDIKTYKSLTQKKYREKYGFFLIEGEKTVEEALKSGYPLHKIITASDTDPANYITKSTARYNIPVETVSSSVFHRISSHKSPDGILAVGLIKQENSLEEMSEGSSLLILDDIQDPGNVGTIIRSAEWFGINRIILSEGCADIYSPKVVRAAMGSLFRCKVYRSDDLETVVGGLKRKGIELLAASLNGMPLNVVRKKEKWALILGNEGHGIDERLLKTADKLITVPGGTVTESLNVAQAAAVILYHFTQVR